MKRNGIQKTFYNGLILPVAYGALAAASPFHAKLRDTFRARRGLAARWNRLSQNLPGRPVWFHVASAGEYEQARPVITELNERYPDVPVAITFTSPSGFRYATRESLNGNVAFVEYLPVDWVRNARFCLDSLRPRLLVFVKFDLWPNLIWQAEKQGVPSILIDATLSQSSHRLSRIGRRFYRSVYDRLAKILAISAGDARRFQACSPNHAAIIVTGDTRFDRVMERKRSNNGPEIDLADERFVVVAGSTWPQDEHHLLGALAQFAGGDRKVALIIAPHEPSTERVADLLSWAKSRGLEATTLSRRGQSARNGNVQVIVIDSVGVLAEVYRFGDAAYIGGSFSSGVHNVIEPAIMGIPVLFGPAHNNSVEARELIARKAAFEVKNQREIYERLESLLNDAEQRRTMGQQAKAYVEAQLGATQRCVKEMAEYI